MKFLPFHIFLFLLFIFHPQISFAQNRKFKEIINNGFQKIKSLIEYHKEYEREREGEGEGENEEYDGPDKAAAYEFLITKDPSTGTVPRERLMEAIEKTKKSKNNPIYSDPVNYRRVANYTWIERGPFSDTIGISNDNTRQNGASTAGRVRAIMVDSSDVTRKTVWVGGVDGGLWKTTDITKSIPNWQLVNDFLSNLAVTDICQDPTNYDVMYFCTGEAYFNFDAVKGNGVFKSTDHGLTWTQLSSSNSFGYCTRILCDYLGNIYLATRSNGVQRSTNGGTSWTNITPTGIVSDICDMEISSTGSSGRLHIVSGIFSSQAYRYTDVPSTASSSTGWNTPISAFPSYSQRAEIACKGNVLYALPVNSSYQVPSIYKSLDGGANWTATSGQPTSGWASGQGWYSLSIDINPSNTNQCIIGGLEAYKTSNGGSSWSKISNWYGTTGQYIHADMHKILWYDAGNKLLIGCDGGVHFSSDGGSTIRDRNIGLRIKQFYSCAIHPTSTNYFLAGAQDNGVHQLNGTGLTKSIEVMGGDGAFVAIDQNEPAYQFGTYVYNSYDVSTDGGNNWVSIDFKKGTSSSPSDFGSFINPYDYDNNENIIYAAADAGEFFRWTSSNSTPSDSYYYSAGFPSGASIVSSITALNNAKVSAVKVSPYTSNRVYFGTTAGRIIFLDNANIAPSSSSGNNITGSGMPGGNVSCINVGTNDQYIIASFSNYGVNNVWVSYNGGSSWNNIDGNLADMPVRWCMYYPGDNTKAIIATETGVFTTDLINGSSTVWNASSSFPVVRTDMIKYRESDGTMIAATHGRGLWSTTVSPCTTPIISIIADNSLCLSQTLNLTATSDQSTATYSWSGPNSFTSTQLSPSISNVTLAAAGRYTLTAVYDGCTTSTSINIVVNSLPSTPTANLVQPTCTVNTGTVTVPSVLTGLTFSLNGVDYSNTTGVFNNVSIGTYNLTCRNSNGCISTNRIVTINPQPSIPALPTSNISQPTCTVNTGTITVTSSLSGLSFSIDGLNFTNTTGIFTNVNPGIYNLIAKSNSSGCLSQVSAISVNNQPAIPNAPSVSFAQPTCNVSTGTATITSSLTGLSFSNDGSNYLNTSGIFTNLLSGSYNFTAKNITTGCISSITAGAINTQPSSPSSPTANVLHPTCTVSTGTLTVSSTLSGLTFSINGIDYSNNTGVFNFLIPGNYNLTSKYNSNGCISSPSIITVNNQPYIPVPPTIAFTHPTCTINKGTATITSSLSGLSFSNDGINYNNTNGLFSNLTSGTYSFTAKSNLSGCVSDITTGIINNQPPTPAVPSVSITHPACTVNTGSVSVNSTLNNLSFSIDGLDSNTTGIFNGLFSGNHTITAKNLLYGCVSNVGTFTINSIPQIPIKPNAVNISICDSGLAVLIALHSTDETIDWYNSSSGGDLVLQNRDSLILMLNSSSTFYAQSKLNSTGCNSIERTPVIATIKKSTYSYLNAYACNQYLWHGRILDSNGTYIFSGTNSVGCDSIETLNLIVTNNDISLELTILLEGYVNIDYSMVNALYDLQISSDSNLVDSIEINLWSPNNLGNEFPDYTCKTTLTTNAKAQAVFPCATIGKYYYVAVKHRNTIETWSKNPVLIKLNNYYNFSDSVNHSFGNGINPPIKYIGSGKFAAYSGDINQDGSADVLDLQDVENDAYQFQFGYINSDCNGDGAADALDMQIIENNSMLFIYKARPL